MRPKAQKTKSGQPRGVGGRKVVFPRISQEARELGVSRIHLWLVLTGKRVSHRLAARYANLQRKARAA